MKVLYCDGSEKKDGTIVVSFVLATREETYGRIRSVEYCYKQTMEKTQVGGCAEILACLSAWTMLPELNINNEQVILINDNISNISILKDIQKGLRSHKKCSDSTVSSLLSRLPKCEKEIWFKQKPRQTMGLVLADYLNYETDKWVRPVDSRFVALRMRQMINRPWDYML